MDLEFTDVCFRSDLPFKDLLRRMNLMSRDAVMNERPLFLAMWP